MVSCLLGVCEWKNANSNVTVSWTVFSNLLLKFSSHLWWLIWLCDIIHFFYCVSYTHRLSCPGPSDFVIPLHRRAPLHFNTPYFCSVLGSVQRACCETDLKILSKTRALVIHYFLYCLHQFCFLYVCLLFLLCLYFVIFYKPWWVFLLF